MNLVNLLAANSAGADLIVIAGDSTVPIYTLIVHPSIKSYADLKESASPSRADGPAKLYSGADVVRERASPQRYENDRPRRRAAALGGGAESGRSGRADQPAFGFHRACNPDLARWDFQPTTSTIFNTRSPAYAATGRKKTKPSRCGSYAPILKPASFSTTRKQGGCGARARRAHQSGKRGSGKNLCAVHENAKNHTPRRGIDLQGARKVAENWKDFRLQKLPPPIDGLIDMSYLAEARK